MFEERGADEVTEFRPYRATAWRRIPEFSEPSLDAAAADPIRETANHPGISFQVFSDILKPIRKLISEHENWLLIAVVLILICDCEDDLELLIAAAILLLPAIRGLF